MARSKLLTERTVRYPGYQKFFSRAAGIFGVGRRPTRLRALEKSLAPRVTVRRGIGVLQNSLIIHKEKTK